LSQTFRGQFELAVVAHQKQSVALHSGYGLRHSRPGMIEAFRDARSHRNLTFFN
jgi:hypothetical protein